MEKAELSEVEDDLFELSLRVEISNQVVAFTQRILEPISPRERASLRMPPFFPGHGMRIVERHNGCIRPVPGRFGLKLIRSPRIVGIRLRKLGYHQELFFGMGPALLIFRLPGQAVVQYFDLPDAVFFHIGILVDSAFPELARYRRGLRFAFVDPAHQENTKTAHCGFAIR